jgi:hypothetical protein
MIVTATLYAPLIASYNMPYQSLGAELTPGRGERTSVQTSVVRGEHTGRFPGQNSSVRSK